MRCCRNLLAVMALLAWVATSAQAKEPEKMIQADSLLASPSLDMKKAQQALALYEDLLQGDPVLFARLSRACFVLGDMAPREERAHYYEKGLAYAEKVLAQQPDGVAGHYWRAMNLSGLADVGGQIQGFKLLPKIMDELKKVLALDETYDQAGVHRVLGRIYYEAPAWPISVGDREKSLQHLKTAVRLAPENSTNHLFLAATLLALGKKELARVEYEKVLEAKKHAIQPQGLEEDRREARSVLQTMKNQR